MYGSIGQYMAVYGNARQYMAVCGVVWGWFVVAYGSSDGCVPNNLGIRGARYHDLTTKIGKFKIHCLFTAFFFPKNLGRD